MKNPISNNYTFVKTTNQFSRMKAQDAFPEHSPVRRFLNTAAAGAAALSLGVSLAEAADEATLREKPGMAQRPNILVLLTDDLRRDAMGYNNPRIQTPNLDRLAAEGMIFNRAYTASPICTASRAALLTGVYPQQNGVVFLGWKNGVMNRHARREDRDTLPQILSDHGYSTALLGKSHLGDPLMYGFQESVDLTAIVRDDSRVTQYAMEFLSAAARDERPFFLWCALHQPHLATMMGLDEKRDTQWLARYDSDAVRLPPSFRKEPLAKSVFNQGASGQNIYRDGEVKIPWNNLQGGPPRDEAHMRTYTKGYSALVSRLDDNIGQILTRLKELGLDENTIIIFTSDNGNFLGEHGLGNKITMHEESVGVPMMIAGPIAERSRGKRSDALVSTLDVFPTVLDAAGIKKPDYLMGRSLVPLLNDPAAAIREFVHSESSGDYKMGEGHRMVRNHEWKYVWTDADEEFLFHEPSDPYEMNNVAALPKHRDVLGQMRTEMRQWQDAMGDRKRRPSAEGGAEPPPAPVAPNPEAAKAPRFEVTEADGGDLVTDRLNGLMWMRAPHLLAGNDQAMTWRSARAFSEQVSFGAFRDWRLPTYAELLSMIEFGQLPTLPDGHPFIGIKEGFYWAVEEHPVGVQGAAGTLLNLGKDVLGMKPPLGNVWLVRDANASAALGAVAESTPPRQAVDPAAARFVITTQGTDEMVVDHVTGLTWVKAPHRLPGNAKPLSWQDADAFCRELSYGGYDDWRMPDSQELKEMGGCPLVERRKDYYWSACAYPGLPIMAWLVRAHDGYLNAVERSHTSNVCPVRGDSK